MGIWFFVATSLLFGAGGLYVVCWTGRYTIDDWASFWSEFSLVEAWITAESVAFLAAAAGLVGRRRWGRPALVFAWGLQLGGLLWLSVYDLQTLIYGTVLALAVWYFYFRKPVRAYYASLK